MRACGTCAHTWAHTDTPARMHTHAHAEYFTLFINLVDNNLTPEAVLTGLAFNFGRSTYTGGIHLKRFLKIT